MLPARGWIVALRVLPLIACLCTPAAATDIGWVARINGAPTRERTGTSAPLHQNDAVVTDDVIVTDGASKAKVLLADDSVLDIGTNTRVILSEFRLQSDQRTARLQVVAGRFKLAIAKFFGGPSDYEVRTPTAVVGVRGTVLWGDTDLDTICALDGTITVRSLTGTKEMARLSGGHCARRMAAGKATPFMPSPTNLASYLRAVTLQ